jgi:predicted HTH transcriptional regulator
MIALTDQDLRTRLEDTEDHFVERKTASDTKGWLLATVAFANSVPVDYPAVLFINVRADGRIEDDTNLDKLQQTYSSVISGAYPPIYTLSHAVSTPRGTALAIIIPGSANAPHFAGKAFVREGSQTKEASAAQFEELLTRRSDKARELLKRKGTVITVSRLNPEHLTRQLGQFQNESPGTILDCNQFWVTIQSGQATNTFPLPRILLAYDHQHDRLRLEIRPA